MPLCNKKIGQNSKRVRTFFHLQVGHVPYLGWTWLHTWERAGLDESSDQSFWLI